MWQIYLYFIRTKFHSGLLFRGNWLIKLISFIKVIMKIHFSLRSANFIPSEPSITVKFVTKLNSIIMFLVTDLNM